jgi:hypothetical protein
VGVRGCDYLVNLECVIVPRLVRHAGGILAFLNQKGM